MESGVGYTTLGMYLLLLNCTLEMVKMVNFMLCTFFNNRKNRCKLQLRKGHLFKEAFPDHQVLRSLPTAVGWLLSVSLPYLFPARHSPQSEIIVLVSL